MRTLGLCTSIAAATFFLMSCSGPLGSKRSTRANEERSPQMTHGYEASSERVDTKVAIQPVHRIVEAERMRLISYEIENDGSTTFAALTGSNGVAQFTFSLPSGYYSIDVRYLAESVGQNTYALYVANDQIVAWLGKNRDDQWHLLSEQKWHAPHQIAIDTGDEIRIEALSDNGSLGILDYVEFTALGRPTSAPPHHITRPTPPPPPTTPPVHPPGVITVYPDEYDHALHNPLKGFRPSTIYSGITSQRSTFDPSRHNHEYGSLIKTYFKWNELETCEGDDVSRIKTVCDAKWSGIENKNIKIIPRVYLAWPRQSHGWPADMTPGDATSEQFKHRVIALIKKLGQAWDNDSRVAYVEMGIIGEWGEMEWPDTSDDIKGAMAAQFNASFQNKLVMIRWPNTYCDHLYNFGYYWDSFAHHDQDYYAYHLKNTSPRWKTAVIGGETAYNWGSVQIQPGRHPEESLSQPAHRDHVIDTIRALHANHLGWIADYDHQDENVRAGAEIVQRALGYRFVISEVTYPRRIDTDTDFRISFKVKNTGSSPFYYNWPVEVSLLDPNTRHVVWRTQCDHIDIRNWMPGDQWDPQADAYAVPAKTYAVAETLRVSSISPGEYILALAILDPAGCRPSARFAIRNYYNGGWHPIGKLGVNSTIESCDISDFDDLHSDTSLSYSKPGEQTNE